jgi:vacuolar protein sorting-associated protein 13A/C
LLERINIQLEVQNSIVPKAHRLAKVKISGKLPSLQVNMSDIKYKSLMRLIDVCMPKFEDENVSQLASGTPKLADKAAVPFKLPPLFSQAEAEYGVADESDESDKDDSASHDGPFFNGNMDVSH